MKKTPNVRAIRKRLGLNQQEFATALGVTFASVSRWELGKVRPSHLALDRIERIARLGRKRVQPNRP